MSADIALLLVQTLAGFGALVALTAALVVLDRVAAPHLLRRRRAARLQRLDTGAPDYPSQLARLDALYTDAPSQPRDIVRTVVRQFPWLAAIAIGGPLLSWFAR